MRPYYGWVLFSQTLSPLNQSLPTDPKLFPRAPSFSITAPKVKVGKPLKATIDVLKQVPEPILLLGDFNRQPWHNEVRPLKEMMVDSCEDTKRAIVGAEQVTWR